jgi:hypothetical protein
MKQHQVRLTVALSSSPGKAASGPAGLSGDFLGANRAASLLFKPEMHQSAITFPVVDHLKTETLFKVAFPVRVIGIGLASDFDVSLDGRGLGFAQMNGLPFFVLV